MSKSKPIGKIIREVLDRRGMKLKVFAERIGTTRQNVYKIFEKDSVQTSRLETICRVLEYDFFQHLGAADPEKTEPWVLEDPGFEYASPHIREKRLREELEAAQERIRMLEARLEDKESIIELLRAQVAQGK